MDNKPRGLPLSLQGPGKLQIAYDLINGGKTISFEQFMTSGQHTGLLEKELFCWFSRLVLRWSCSSIASMLYQHILPAVPDHKLYVDAEDRIVDLQEAELWALHFEPD